MTLILNHAVRSSFLITMILCSLIETTQKREFVTGINSSVEELKKGKNENLRVYSYDNTSYVGFASPRTHPDLLRRITPSRTKETISTYNEEHYQVLPSPPPSPAHH